MKLALAGAAIMSLPVLAVAALVPALPLAVGSGGPGPMADIPPSAAAAYEAGARWCPGLAWTVLAGIGEVESDHGRAPLPGVRSGTNEAGAAGPMQFLAPTFGAFAEARGSAPPSVYDLSDAAVAAARYLCASGATRPGGLRGALWAYNHSDAYVDDVLGWVRRYSAATGGGRGSVALAWALAQLGRPYGWGAAGPDAYDCSGLVLRAWEAAGVVLPRVAADQYRAGPWVPLALAQPGDLVFFAPDTGDPSTVEHVGIVAGAGLMVDAPHTGATVRLTAFYDGIMPFVVRPKPGAGRPGHVGDHF